MGLGGIAGPIGELAGVGLAGAYGSPAGGFKEGARLQPMVERAHCEMNLRSLGVEAVEGDALQFTLGMTSSVASFKRLEGMERFEAELGQLCVESRGSCRHSLSTMEEPGESRPSFLGIRIFT